MAHIEHFDDPLNPHGWAAEPALRRLRMSFPDLSWTFRPTVLFATWEDYEGPEFENGRQGAAATCARVSERSDMPIDEYLWFEDPPSSSLDACLAVAAAAEQSETAGQRALRALREATFIRRSNVSERDALRSALSSAPGVDADAVIAALEDGTAESALASRRDARENLTAAGVQMVGDRPRLPTVVVRGDADVRGLSGRRNYGSYRGAVTDVTDLEPAEDRPSVDEILDRFSPEGWVSAAELSALAGEPPDVVADRAAEMETAGGAVRRSFASESFWRRPDDAGTEGDETEG